MAERIVYGNVFTAGKVLDYVLERLQVYTSTVGCKFCADKLLVILDALVSRFLAFWVIYFIALYKVLLVLVPYAYSV